MNGSVPTTPSLTINDVSANEGNSGTTVFAFNVSLFPAGTGGVTFDIATQDNSAATADESTMWRSFTDRANHPCWQFDSMLSASW